MKNAKLDDEVAHSASFAGVIALAVLILKVAFVLAVLGLVVALANNLP